MKTEIKRSELQKIWEISCAGWKPRLQAYATGTPFSETIKFTENQINEMIEACTDVQLPIVKEIFDVRDTWKDIKTLEDACKQLGEVDNEVRQLRLLQNIPNLERRVVAGQELAVIAKALNNGTVLDWDDSNESKCYVWFDMRDKGSCYGWLCGYSRSSVPASLCLKSSEIAEYFGRQFEQTYREYMK